MELKKIEHITLHLIVFGTIAIIGVLARQTVLHYGWDEFSSYLILVVCSIIMGAIYLNLQMVFNQILSPTIEKCFMRFECYRNKLVVVETPIAHAELVESSIISESCISEPKIEIETTSDTTEKFLFHRVQTQRRSGRASKGRSHTFYHQQYIHRRIQSANRIRDIPCQRYG